MTRTRKAWSRRGALIAVALAFFCATGVAYAYLSGLTNAAPNDFTTGAVSVSVVECDASGSIIADPSQAAYGANAKNVTLKVPAGYATAIVRARIVPPQVSTGAGASTVYQAYNAGTSAVAQPDANNQVVAGGFVLHFASDWSANWLWKDGSFYYRHTVSAGHETSPLLTGVTLSDGYTPAGNVQVTVTSDAIQAAPAAAAAQWGLSVDGSGVVGSL